MNTRQRSQMPHPAPSYRTPLPTTEVNQDGILHPALIPRRRPGITANPFHRTSSPSRTPATGPTRQDVRPPAVPGYAPAVTPSDRARDDRLFEDLVANAADASHTIDRDEHEAEDDFDVTSLDSAALDEIEKGAEIEVDEISAEDDEEGRKAEFPAD